jgi:hypothetical protein
MKRVDSVDVLRALALIGMVICHYPIFLILFAVLWAIYEMNQDKTKEPGIFLAYCRQISKYLLTILCKAFCPLHLFHCELSRL